MSKKILPFNLFMPGTFYLSATLPIYFIKELTFFNIYEIIDIMSY